MEYYTAILSLHVIAVMSWMGMIFYQPRLYVYHQENKENKEFTKIVKIQEYKLYKYIGLNAMYVAILSGAFMIYLNPALFKMPWFHAKLTVVILLIIYTFSLGYYRKQLEQDDCKRDGKFFRAYNELPTLYAILIVTFVIMKTIPVYFSIFISLFFIFIMYIIVRKKKNSNTLSI